MQFLGHVCLLLIGCSVIELYKRLFQYIAGFFFMGCVSWFKFFIQNYDFGFGFLVFACLRQLFNLVGLILLFNFGLKILQFGYYFKGVSRFIYQFRGKSTDLRNRFCLLDLGKVLKPEMIGHLGKTKGHENGDLKANSVQNGERDDESEDEFVGNFHDEEEVVDVMTLRKLVKMERQKANAAYLELEKERIATASAADEAMAMILRLQNEKSLIEMEANQFRRLAEEKQIHDQEVIQSLRWIVLKHESERSYLEGQLRFYRRRLKLSKGDEGDHYERIDESSSFFNSNTEGSPCDALISSLDFDMSPLLMRQSTK